MLTEVAAGFTQVAATWGYCNVLAVVRVPASLVGQGSVDKVFSELCCVGLWIFLCVYLLVYEC